jgi:hypothetical protein
MGTTLSVVVLSDFSCRDDVAGIESENHFRLFREMFSGF